MRNIDKYNNEEKKIDNDVFLKLDDYGDKYIMLGRLPGAIKDQISINYDNDQITIGTFVRENKQSSGNGFYMSVTQSTFINKSFSIPNAKISEIKGNFDGLNLTLEIPKNIASSENIEFIDVDNFTDI